MYFSPMLLKIADIPIKIDDNLLCEQVRDYLQPFAIDECHPLSVQSYKIILERNFQLRSDIAFSTRTGTIQYQEYNSVIVINDTLSYLKIDSDQKCMSVCPKERRYLQELYFISDLKLLLSLLVLEYGGILLHSSAVSRNGVTLLFSGPSGAGKSTIAELLCPPWELTNDEFNILAPCDSMINVFSTPFGKIKGSLYKSLSVQKIYLIIKNDSNKINPISSEKAFLRLAGNVCSFPSSDFYGRKLLENMKNLIELVPVFELYFKKDTTLLPYIDSLDLV